MRGGFCRRHELTCDSPAGAGGDERAFQIADELFFDGRQVRGTHVHATHLIREEQAPGRDVLGFAAEEALLVDEVRGDTFGDQADDCLRALDASWMQRKPGAGGQAGGVETEECTAVEM
nr:hypothetical protein CFP56_25853 [Quercus suber]